MVVDVIQLKNKQDKYLRTKNIMTKTDSRVKINSKTVTSSSGLNSGVSSLRTKNIMTKTDSRVKINSKTQKL